MKIPFINLYHQNNSLKTEIIKKIEKIIEKSDFILGDEVALFEKNFAKFCGTDYSITVANGTDALTLSLKALGIGKEDEVIVPDFSFYATAGSVLFAGAKPVFVDIDPETLNIDTNLIEKKINKKTKAIIPVHIFGNPADMGKIIEIADCYKLKIIEDASQAHGAKIMIKNKLCRVGSVGDVGCFSFYPTKNLSVFGDGGAITTNNKDIVEKIKMLRNCGRDETGNHKILGYNSRLDTIHAGILNIKLSKIDQWNKKRKEIARIYQKKLSNLPAKFQKIQKNSYPVYHQFVIITENRNEIKNFLKNENISTSIYYPTPLHLLDAFKDLCYKRGDFPITEEISKKILSLPIFPELKYDEILYICDKIKTFFNRQE